MKKKTAKEKITNENKWVNCYICETVFARRRETFRYCSICENAFCEGEHGNFSNGVGHCILCDTKLKKVK